MIAAFFVAGDPKGQPRPRAFSRGGKVRVYDPGTAEGWKGLIAVASALYRPHVPLSGPIRVDLTFHFRRPARLQRRNDPEGAILHTSKPDLDNLAKAVLDIMTQLGWWKDDAQVCGGRWSKAYAPKQDSPGVWISVGYAEEETLRMVLDADPSREYPDHRRMA